MVAAAGVPPESSNPDHQGRSTVHSESPAAGPAHGSVPPVPTRPAGSTRRPKRAGGVSSQALSNRKRRADPAKRRAERAAEDAVRDATRAVLDLHSQEYVVRLQEARRKRGLPPIRLRRHRPPAARDPRPAAAIQRHGTSVGNPSDPKPMVASPPPGAMEPDEAQQAKCRHNGGLNKLPYGTFCLECGKRIR